MLGQFLGLRSIRCGGADAMRCFTCGDLQPFWISPTLPMCGTEKGAEEGAEEGAAAAWFGAAQGPRGTSPVFAVRSSVQPRPPCHI